LSEVKFGVELHMLAQVVSVDDVLQIGENFGLFDIMIFPVVIEEVFFVPTVTVDWFGVSVGCW
jgi:hypothetical protein